MEKKRSSAERLELGIDNIDRMNRRIRIVVEKVCERILCEIPSESTQRIELGGGWVVCRNNRALELFNFSDQLFGYGGYRTPPLHDVVHIHIGLDALVDGVIGKFPLLYLRIAPFFDVADM